EDPGQLRAPPPPPAESSARTLGSIQAGHASPRLSSRRSRWDKQDRDGEGHPEGGVDRPVERVYEDIYRFGGHPDGGRASARSPGGSAPLSLVCSRTVPLRWPRDRVIRSREESPMEETQTRLLSLNDVRASVRRLQRLGKRLVGQLRDDARRLVERR